MSSRKTALVLGGGGARAAYQVGVLLAIRDLLGDSDENPFPILCGTSAGAVNAATLACYADSFGAAVGALAKVWRNMRAGQVYRADPLGVAAASLRWLGGVLVGWAIGYTPRALLDSSPLRDLLVEQIDFSRLDRLITRGSLYALSVTASGYGSGNSVSFFQAHPEVVGWQRAQRLGCRAQLSVDHLLASSAIPFLFPAVHINREYFGDGSMRQLAPVSPAIHLGAERVLIIGVGQMSRATQRQSAHRYPTLAQIAGHTLSSIFLDGLTLDVERIERINDTLEKIPHGLRTSGGIRLRQVQSLVIAPSQRLDHLAARHAYALPRAVRMLLRALGAMNRRGGALTSYLLFESAYTGALIDLGYRDAMAKRERVQAFLDLDR